MSVELTYIQDVSRKIVKFQNSLMNSNKDEISDRFMQKLTSLVYSNLKNNSNYPQ